MGNDPAALVQRFGPNGRNPGVLVDNEHSAITYEIITATNADRNHPNQTTQGYNQHGVLVIYYRTKLTVNGQSYTSAPRQFVVTGFLTNDQVLLQLLNTNATWTKKANLPAVINVTKASLGQYVDGPILTTENYTKITATNDITTTVTAVEFDQTSGFLKITYQMQKHGLSLTKTALVPLVSVNQKNELQRLNQAANALV